MQPGETGCMCRILPETVDMLRRSLESQSVPAAYIEQVQANIHSFSDFLGWAEAQKPDTGISAYSAEPKKS